MSTLVETESGDVRAALAQALRQNYGDVVFVSTARLLKSHTPCSHLTAQGVACVLRDLEEGSEQFDVERSNPNAQKARWRVERAGAGQ